MPNALLFIDGFDHETNGAGNADLLTKWTGVGPGGAGWIGPDNTVHAFGGASLKAVNGTNNSWFYKGFAAPLTEIIIGFAFNPNANSQIFFGFDPLITGPSGFGVDNVQVVWNRANQALDFFGNGGGPHFGSTPNGSVPALTWTYIEVDIVFNNGAGTIDCDINGVSVLTLAGLNTAPILASASSFTIYQNVGGDIAWFDDLYILNPVGAAAPYNAMLGGCRVQTLYPTANVAVQWTPNAGTNFSEVNAVQFNNGATFNAAGTVGFQDTLDNNALYSNPVSIFGVAVTGAYAQDTPAAGIAVENILKSGVTTAPGTPTPVPAGANTYAYAQDIFQDDPNTAAAWLAAGVNAVEIGYNRTA